MIHCFLLLTLFIPALSSIILATSAPNEHAISRFAQTSFLLYLVTALVTSAFWLFQDSQTYLYSITSLLTFKLDLPGLVYLCTTAFITNIILFYCRRYLHRDPGYQRFFMIISMFVAGLTVVIFAGNFELIFAGWEVVGLSSYLLIGFYWHRPQAALNASRAYYIYRICDLGLLAAAFISHLEPSFNQQWALSLMILLAVIGKSAQFPVSYWLPRAMEGPTPSSAIFYGALSIHAGVFLLMRTFDTWFYTPGFSWVVGSLGLITALLATLFGRVQANIKGQIGYASITQVGIMLIELACGFPTLALIHMTGNACLRCFQLLVSPSVVAQQLQIHGALLGERVKPIFAIHDRLNHRIRDTLYLIAINEAYLQSFLKAFLVRPVNALANRVNQIERRAMSAWVIAPALLGSAFLLAPLSYLFLGLSLFAAFTALGESKSPFRVFNAATLSNLFVASAIWFEHRDTAFFSLLYMAGLGVAWLLALDALRVISKKQVFESVIHFSGLFGQYPLASVAVLVGILGIIGFPLSSTFWFEDHLLEHALASGWIFVAVFAGVFALNGITLIRLYSHLFWGKREHEPADTSHDFSSAGVFARIAVFMIANGVQLWLL